MRVGSLFSGIGGLDLGLERAGMTVAWQSEIDPYAGRVLAMHWPDTPNLGDITAIDWSEVEPVDVICGGYPCQPFSYAGRRGGSSDERHLWPFMLDAIRILRPRFLVAENVAGHLSLGLDRVLADLASLGFDAEWSTVSACSMGAPHTRNRLFIVAHTRDERRQWGRQNETAKGPAQLGTRQPEGCGAGEAWAQIPEPDVRGVANGIPHRVDRLRGLGNAVVPQVAEYVGRRLIASAGSVSA